MGGKGRGGKGEGKERGRERGKGRGTRTPSKKSGYGPQFIMQNFTDFWVYEAQNRLLTSSANTEQAQTRLKLFALYGIRTQTLPPTGPVKQTKRNFVNRFFVLLSAH